ncbi:MAG TPA: dephospho-CoA kinase, partial [Candidatus Coprenecus stercoravium]|nr:dephospho-CoA kinase [Candidatus Coprenecus stercoravium]
VVDDFRRWREGAGNGAGFVIMESALYLEKPALKGIADRVLTVVCPQELRIERVMLRSAMTREQVLSRMANQWTDSMRKDASDYVIVSDFSHPLLPQVCDVYDKMREQ